VTIWKVQRPAAKLALNGTFGRQKTFRSKQIQRGIRFHFCDFLAKKFPKQVAHIQMGGQF
jgi:hypothetical protein